MSLKLVPTFPSQTLADLVAQYCANRLDCTTSLDSSNTPGPSFMMIRKAILSSSEAFRTLVNFIERSFDPIQKPSAENNHAVRAAYLATYSNPTYSIHPTNTQKQMLKVFSRHVKSPNPISLLFYGAQPGFEPLKEIAQSKAVGQIILGDIDCTSMQACLDQIPANDAHKIDPVPSDLTCGVFDAIRSAFQEKDLSPREQLKKVQEIFLKILNETFVFQESPISGKARIVFCSLVPSQLDVFLRDFIKTSFLRKFEVSYDDPECLSISDQDLNAFDDIRERAVCKLFPKLMQHLYDRVEKGGEIYLADTTTLRRGYRVTGVYKTVRCLAKNTLVRSYSKIDPRCIFLDEDQERAIVPKNFKRTMVSLFHVKPLIKPYHWVVDCYKNDKELDEPLGIYCGKEFRQFTVEIWSLKPKTKKASALTDDKKGP